MYKLYNKEFLTRYPIEPENVVEDDIKIYLTEKLSDENLSTKSISLIKAALLFYYNEILGKKLDIKTPKIKKTTPVVLTKIEIEKLFPSTVAFPKFSEESLPINTVSLLIGNEICIIFSLSASNIGKSEEQE